MYIYYLSYCSCLVTCLTKKRMKSGIQHQRKKNKNKKNKKEKKMSTLIPLFNQHAISLTFEAGVFYRVL